jgi:hypothetical protein
MLLVGFLVPAFAGMTMLIGVRTGGSRFRKKLMLLVGFWVPAFAGITMYIGVNRRFPLSKKVNVVSWDFGFRLRGNDNAHWGEQEVPAFAGMTMRGVRTGGSRFRGNDKGWVGSGDSSLRWNRNAEPHDK